MPRYTVIIIDHENNNEAQIIETNKVPYSREEPTYSEPTSPSIPTGRVIPNYEAVAGFFTPEPTPKKSSRNKLAEKLKNRFTEEKPKKEVNRRTPYELFQEKLEEERIDDFNAKDLVYFFKFTAEKKGINLAVNWQRDCSQAKKLQDNMKNTDIIAMIEFLFLSKQDYLTKRKLSIGVLNSGWMNTIYQDSQDWLEDKYTPKKIKDKKPREWSEDKPTNGTNVQIGWSD